jgi:hypothetical protein
MPGGPQAVLFCSTSFITFCGLLTPKAQSQEAACLSDSWCHTLGTTAVVCRAFKRGSGREVRKLIFNASLLLIFTRIVWRHFITVA